VARVRTSTPRTPDGLIPRREDESREAARILGVKDLVFLGYTDGALEPTLALRRDLTRVIRQQHPDVVVCGDPTTRWYGDRYLKPPRPPGRRQRRARRGVPVRRDAGDLP